MRSSLLSSATNSVDNPDFCEASASAKPPPSRKMTPQHIRVSIRRQVINEGELVTVGLHGANGQKL